MEEESGSIVGPIIGIVLIVVLSIAGIGFFIYKVVNSSNSNNSGGNTSFDINDSIIDNNGNDNKDNPEVAKGEKDIEDSSIVQELEEKANYLFSMNSADDRNPLFKKNMTVNDLSDLDMITVALEIANKQLYVEETICYKSDSKTISNNCDPNNYVDVGDYVFTSELSQVIKNIFGRDINIQKHYDYCPELVLYKDKLFMVENCGGSSLPEEINYIYKTTEKDGYYYVYVAHGVFIAEGSRGWTLYADNEGTKKYKENVSVDSFTIDHDTYNDFSKYKITFEKKNNGYVFSKIEKK